MRPPARTPDDDATRDPELARLLEEWTVPALPDTLDRRMLASFRARSPRASLWRRFFTTSLHIPLPVALAALLLLALAFWMPRGKSVPPLESSEPLSGPRTAQFDHKPPMPDSLSGFEPVREMNVTVLPSDAQ
jgi:hypothetical protein